MKKVVFLLAIAVVLIAVMAAPALAAKPLLAFNPGLSSNIPIVGTLATGFSTTLGGTAGVFHDISLTNSGATPAIKNGMYAFSLKAEGPQKASLSDYFSAKGLPEAWYDQIRSEIVGGSPFFYLKADNGAYSLVDGFSYAVFGTTFQTLRIDDDYPAGTYVYKGHLKAENGALMQVDVTLIISR
jgi:hypothetical protein